MLAAGPEGRPARVPGAELGGRAGGLPSAGRARRRLPLHARTSRNKVHPELVAPRTAGRDLAEDAGRCVKTLLSRS
ncbi:hypothetical protein AV530_015324 [Patagioenas fasciata monilis]|uniref:Uncharacterized protein n=1 Tax=Patagioenas fasciata monilis TaxID=372326 RepID=A0A1V4K1X9_PATFA|nr:hypothetical protein AV530_015324 [Patagioenas fasciata monilis]